MSEDKIVAEEKVEQKVTPTVDDYIDKRQAEQADKKFGSPKPIVEDEVKVEKTETKKEEAVPAESDPSPEKKEPEESIEDKITKAVEEKTKGLQKRIDKLTAEKYALKEKEETKTEVKKDSEKVYTEEELNRAEDKAYNNPEGVDYTLVREIAKERQKNFERGLVERYENAEKSKYAVVEKQQAAANEWLSIENDFSNNAKNERYPKNKEFNIKDTTSTLFKRSKALYEAEDSKYLSVQGGMTKAVSDAFRELILEQQILDSEDDKEKEKLEKKLAKEKMKNQVGVGSANKTSENVEKADPKDVESYLDARLAEQNKRRYR